ncbi:unnamed protein product [Phaeothamnion confervicola]
MTVDIFFLIGYILLVLLIWAIPFFRNILSNYKPELFGFSAGYLFVLADIKSDNETKVLFEQTWKDLNTTLIVVGVALGLMGIILSAIEKGKQKTLSALNGQLTETKEKLEKVRHEYYSLCSDNIKEIFHQFFIESGGNGRISLYKHDGHSFTLLGRASDNPVHRKRGQEIYPDTEGFIAKGWQDGTYTINSIPAWVGKSGTDYRRFMRQNCDITDERLKKLTMRSRSFYIYRFNNNNADNPHGIIVFEKLSELPIQTAQINTAFQSHQTQLISLLKSMRSLTQ